jgi:hypothetical protein
MSTRIVFFREIVFVDIDFNFLGVKTRGNALKGFFFFVLWWIMFYVDLLILVNYAVFGSSNIELFRRKRILPFCFIDMMCLNFDLTFNLLCMGCCSCPCYRFGKNMRRAGFGSCFLQVTFSCNSLNFKNLGN